MIDQPSPLGSPLDGKRIVLLSFGEAYRNSEDPVSSTSGGQARCREEDWMSELR